LAITEENIGLMEPMLPPDGERSIEDLAVDLATKASGLASQLPQAVRRSMGDLVRSMNCYYSNLIEGHDTHPRDIDRALAHSDYSTEPEKRALQLEAVAHIEVQRLIDHREDLQAEPTSTGYITWLHREFCLRLPDELLWVQNPDTGERLPVVAGELRKAWVQIGRHIPPGAEALPRFLKRFAEVYEMQKLSRSPDRRPGSGPSSVALDTPLLRRQRACRPPDVARLSSAVRRGKQPLVGGAWIGAQCSGL
jgi:hypothetical protein